VSNREQRQFEEKFSDEALNNSTPDVLKLATKVSMYNGDITKLEIDAIVNTTDESLLGASGYGK
jgi:hypothetical protein